MSFVCACIHGGNRHLSIRRRKCHLGNSGPLEEALAIARKTQPDFQLPARQPEAQPQPKAEDKPVRKKTLPAKVKQFKEAVVDLATGNVVSLPVFQERLAACERNECGHLIVAQKGWWLKAAEKLGLKTPVEQPLFCNACGCGSVNPLAELHTKLWAPGLECPCEEPEWTKENTPVAA